MRGIIRKAISIDSTVWIIVLSLTLIAIYLAFVPQAEAVTRAEFDELKRHAAEIEENIADADQRLVEQNRKISEHDDFIDTLRQDLRNITEKNWDAIQQKIDLELEISGAVQELESYRSELGEIIREKSDWIRELRSLDIDGQVIRAPPLPDLTPKIGIILSKNCITMLQNDIKTDCPSYKSIVTLDSSDTDVSGKFTTDENGYFHRGESAVVRDCKFYDEDRLVIFVDPSTYCLDRIKLIVIENNFDTFTVPGAMTEHAAYEYIQYNVTSARTGITETVDVLEKTSDFARIIFHDRYVDDRCDTATLNAANVTQMLADTIHFMRSECDPSHTSYVTKEIVPIERTPQDYTTTQDYRDKEFLKYVKEFCIFKFKSCS